LEEAGTLLRIEQICMQGDFERLKRAQCPGHNRGRGKPLPNRAKG
jgi:hypothetical protein